MQLNVGKEVAALEEMPVSQLRDRYEEVFGETTNASNKQWMIKKIIWRLQSMVEGTSPNELEPGRWRSLALIVSR